jgi:hypothetical protein
MKRRNNVNEAASGGFGNNFQVIDARAYRHLAVDVHRQPLQRIAPSAAAQLPRPAGLRLSKVTPG